MKRMLALLLSAVMLLAASACEAEKDVVSDTEETANDTVDTTATDTQTTEEATTSAEEVKELVTADIALDDNGFFKGIKASEIVALPEYKGIRIDAGYYTPSEEDVQYQIDMVLSGYTEYEQVTDRQVADGDTVNIDYVGSIDGVEFAGGSTGGEGTEVTIGVTNYIDDFLEQLIGHMPGDTFNVEVTFPDDYHVEDYCGKDAIFVTTVNYISEAALAELTDEIASDYGFDTKEALVAFVEQQVVDKQLRVYANMLLEDAVCDEIPEIVTGYLRDGELAAIESTASMYGMTADDFLALYGYESAEAYVNQVATIWLATQAIAEIEGLTVTDEAIKALGFTDDEISTYGIKYIKQYVLATEVVADFIIDNASEAE